MEFTTTASLYEWLEKRYKCSYNKYDNKITITKDKNKVSFYIKYFSKDNEYCAEEYIDKNVMFLNYEEGNHAGGGYGKIIEEVTESEITDFIKSKLGIEPYLQQLSIFDF